MQLILNYIVTFPATHHRLQFTRFRSTEVASDAAPQVEEEKQEYHTIIKDSERGTGESLADSQTQRFRFFKILRL